MAAHTAPPKRLGKVELSLELHPALIPAARFCVIREHRLNLAWLQSQGNGRKGKYRICWVIVPARREQPLHAWWSAVCLAGQDRRACTYYHNGADTKTQIDIRDE